MLVRCVRKDVRLERKKNALHSDDDASSGSSHSDDDDEDENRDDDDESSSSSGNSRIRRMGGLADRMETNSSYKPSSNVQSIVSSAGVTAGRGGGTGGGGCEGGSIEAVVRDARRWGRGDTKVRRLLPLARLPTTVQALLLKATKPPPQKRPPVPPPPMRTAATRPLAGQAGTATVGGVSESEHDTTGAAREDDVKAERRRERQHKRLTRRLRNQVLCIRPSSLVLRYDVKPSGMEKKTEWEDGLHLVVANDVLQKLARAQMGLRVFICAA